MTNPRFSRWIPILILALTPLLALWRAVFTGQAIGPFDQIHQFAPWNGPSPDRPWDVLQADGALQFYAWRDLVFSAWGHGQLPLWNPYALAGTPLMANSQSAALYPPHIVLGMLHVPTGLAMVLLAWFHLAWAGAGTFFLVRRLGGSRIGATVAGSTFALSPFMLAWTGLPSVITTVSWIPWILGGVTALFAVPVADSGEDEPLGLARSTKGPIVGLAACFAMLVLSGHLQFVAYGGFAAILLAVGLTLARRGTGAALAKSWGSFVVAGGLGVMLAAPQLLPVLNYSQFSHRRGDPTAEGYGTYADSAIAPYELGSLPFAPLVGLPSRFADGLPEGSAKVSAYFPQFVRPGDNFAESAVAVGPLALCLLLLAPWRRRGRALLPIAGLGLIALLLAIGTFLNRFLYFGVPGWSASGSPGRIVVLFVLATAVILGLGIDAPMPLPDRGLKRVLPLLLPFVFLGIGTALVGHYSAPTEAAAAINSLSSSALRSAMPGMLLAGIVTAAALGVAYHLERPVNRAVLIVCPFVLAYLAGAAELVPTGDPSFLATSPIAPSDPTARVAVVNRAWGLSEAVRALAPPITPTVARIHDLSGYDSLIHRDTVALLQDIDGQPPTPNANGNIMYVKPSASPAKLAGAGVTEVWTRQEMPQLGTPFATDHEVLRYHVAGPGRASTPAGAAPVKRESLSQLVVSAIGPGRLVVRDRNMPGWIAKVDGRHVPLLGDTWREVDLEAGSHQVEFNYVPPGFMSGCGLALLGLLVLAGLSVSAVLRDRRSREHQV